MRKFNLMSKKREDVMPFQMINRELKKVGHPPIPYPASPSMQESLASNPKSPSANKAKM